MGATRESYQVDLKERQMAYLQKMAENHELADSAKALRCLIDYAIQSPEHEHEIFGVIRCIDCDG